MKKSSVPKMILWIVAGTAIFATAAFFIISRLPYATPVNDTGSGGYEAVFVPENLGRAPTAAELGEARAVIEQRLDAQDISGAEVIADEQNGRIVVRFPRTSDEEAGAGLLIAELTKPNRLTFREGDRDPDGPIVIEGKHIVSAAPSKNSQTGAWTQVDLKLNAEGAVLFEEATTRLVGQAITIYMDDVALSWPTVHSAISGGEVVITGMEDREAAKKLADQINAGALPFALDCQSYAEPK